VTVEELCWNLREYDDDFEVEVFDPETGCFREPKIHTIERDIVCDGQPAKTWVIRL
jgi:hypothetical protein